MKGTLFGPYRLVQTSGACPEQYDVFWGDRQVAYLRLRHGYFTADCPDAGGEMVYEAEPKGDGIFEDDERDFYLSEACKAINKWRKKHRGLLGKRVNE